METSEGDLPGHSRLRRTHNSSFIFFRLESPRPPFLAQGVQEVLELLLALHLSAWRHTMSNGLHEAGQSGNVMTMLSNVNSWQVPVMIGENQILTPPAMHLRDHPTWHEDVSMVLQYCASKDMCS